MKAKREPKIYPIVTINERFRLRLDDQTKILEFYNGKAWVFIGYYRQLEQALKRVAQMETDIGFNTITIKEYIRRILEANEKIHALFDGLQGQAR